MDYSPWSEREIWSFLKVAVSPKLERPRPPKLVCIYILYMYIIYIYIYSNFGIRDDNIQLWIHIGLLAICLILAIINVIVQFIKTIPYGRHDKGDSNFPRIPAHISFAISQFIPGILVLSV